MSLLWQWVTIAREVFGDLRAISFEFIEDPEIEDCWNFCMNVSVGGSVESVSAEYDRYVHFFMERFPYRICRMLVTDVNIVE